MKQDEEKITQKMLNGGQSLGQEKRAKELENLAKKSEPDKNANLKNEIVHDYLQRYEFSDLCKPDKLHEIGALLVENGGDIVLTANKVGITPAVLQALIKTQFILKTYHEMAFEQIKLTNDSELLKKQREGEDWAIKMIHDTLYQGRSKGGYNGNEFGTMGYDDDLAQKQTEQIAEDTKKSSFSVVINFSGEPDETTDFIDAEIIEEIGKSE